MITTLMNLKQKIEGSSEESNSNLLDTLAAICDVPEKREDDKKTIGDLLETYKNPPNPEGPSTLFHNIFFKVLGNPQHKFPDKGFTFTIGVNNSQSQTEVEAEQDQDQDQEQEQQTQAQSQAMSLKLQQALEGVAMDVGDSLSGFTYKTKKCNKREIPLCMKESAKFEEPHRKNY